MSRDDLAIRGWVLTGDSEAVIRAALGARATAETLPHADGWRCVEPVSADVPIGAIGRLVELASEAPATLRFVPGSQGCPPPPDAEAVEVAGVGAGTTLLLDARCWYDTPDGVRATLWSSPAGDRS